MKTEKNVFYDTKILKDEVLTGNVRKSKRIKNVVSDLLTQRYGSIEQTEGIYLCMHLCVWLYMYFCVYLCMYLYMCTHVYVYVFIYMYLG